MLIKGEKKGRREGGETGVGAKMFEFEVGEEEGGGWYEVFKRAVGGW